MKLPRAPEFWWRRHSLAGYALAPIGAFYGRIAGRRMTEGRGVAVGVPVICVGSLVMGGAGKTPTALELARVCGELGLNPGFLSRGYRGREDGPLIVSRSTHVAHEVGDEALLLAAAAPTVVSADRPSGAKLLAGLGADVIIMDDGFHNPSLDKDLALIVVDGKRGTGNGFAFPAGPLRAPLAAQIRRADALVVIGEGSGGAGVRAAARAGLPILRARIEPVRRRFKKKSYLAFTGTGDPRKFYRSLQDAGATIGATMDFPDHHAFSAADCERILSLAEKEDLAPITTEKDYVRLRGASEAAGRLGAAAETFPVRIRFEEPKRLAGLIGDTVANFASAYRQQEVRRSA